jgi:hypothetical protein
MLRAIPVIAEAALHHGKLVASLATARYVALWGYKDRARFLHIPLHSFHSQYSCTVAKGSKNYTIQPPVGVILTNAARLTDVPPLRILRRVFGAVSEK